MPAPTALQRRPEELIQDMAETVPLPEDDEPLITTNSFTLLPTEKSAPPSSNPLPSAIPPITDTEMTTIDPEGRPLFPPSTDTPTIHRIQQRKIPIPPHRMTPLKSSWPKIYPPLVEHLNLQVRMNTKSRAVELRTSRHTTHADALQKGEDFLKAFTLGFDVDDAIALLRLDDLYIETFEIKDVKTLQGEHLGRAIGRIAGKDGKTKFAIENTSRTRVVLADSKIHILGGFGNIRIAREAIVSLILGKPPGKVYGNLRGVAGRMKERF
ncbi:pre-rRNA-processing protein pno1 [Endocarpon pusillum]|uniref:Pre-rRNA-processing protein PNO1 n=1 Tax=Endocarpon pusillum TaxID=364733 RepID=A0A8H7E7G2_9EURO|nr:pre-rRNA-processing protein pno1 [Endocarpon pusillum]